MLSSGNAWEIKFSTSSSESLDIGVAGVYSVLLLSTLSMLIFGGGETPDDWSALSFYGVRCREWVFDLTGDLVYGDLFLGEF